MLESLTCVQADHGKYKVDFSLRGVPVVSQFVPRDTEMW